jgi:CO/xanthine dehydrogenase Mo-binding subunit
MAAVNDFDGFSCDAEGYARGAGTYVDDLRLPSQAHGYVLRSPHAHARLRSIDVARAREHPGVLCVVTDAALALDRDGRFLALSLHTVVRLGAYLSQYTPFVATVCGASVQAGAYRVGTVSARVRGVFYDVATGRLATDSLSTYALPRATHVPAIRSTDNGIPSSTNALGAKACAEASASAAPPAIMNAVADALSRFPGAEGLQMPARAEAIFQVIRSTAPGGRGDRARGSSA